MKKIIPIIILIVITGGVAFYGGIKYGQRREFFQRFLRQDFQNLSPEQRQQFFQENIRGGFQRRVGPNFLSGEVIAKDTQSLTLKMPDGSTKIVFFSDSTKVSKIIDGSISDIEIGKKISVVGQQNPDGSYTAKIIQLFSDY